MPTAHLPLQADSELRLIQMQAHAPPPDIIDRAPWISRSVADVVRKALAKDPRALQIRAELVRALESAYRESRHLVAPLQPTASPPVHDRATSPSLRKLASTEAPPPVAVGVLPPVATPLASSEVLPPPQPARAWRRPVAVAIRNLNQ